MFGAAIELARRHPHNIGCSSHPPQCAVNTGPVCTFRSIISQDHTEIQIAVRTHVAAHSGAEEVDALGCIVFYQPARYFLNSFFSREHIGQNDNITGYRAVSSLHVQIPDVQGVLFDEFPTALHVLAHQRREDLVALDQVF